MEPIFYFLWQLKMMMAMRSAEHERVLIYDSFYLKVKQNHVYKMFIEAVLGDNSFRSQKEKHTRGLSWMQNMFSSLSR